MNENRLAFVTGYKYDKPSIHKTDFLIVNCVRDCYINCFHTFEYSCIYNNNSTKTRNTDIIILPFPGEGFGLYGLNKKLRIARQRGCILNQINTLTTKCFSYLSEINIHYYLKILIPIMHRQLFRMLSQNPEYAKTHCIEFINTFHSAICNWMIKQEIDIDEN